MNAAQSRQIGKVATLLDHDADPSAADARGFTALHRTAETILFGTGIELQKKRWKPPFSPGGRRWPKAG
ncbi:ankyrin repeat domain-containing protein [Paludisphaera rhizosphaerae]|uniref:ankyrin repeat domain-containing protein n=1 Tax=Paludisphaera rhizosphaerae TaxID=2711216 RepID=UPI0013EB57B9|nr:ankyrin repeat domain-containing protein [Paludisphaera rhizosphaerae]